MNSSNTAPPKEPKRIHMACTYCRHKKLKCRTDVGQVRCQRCIHDGITSCLFIPVSADNATSSPTENYGYSQQLVLTDPTTYQSLPPSAYSNGTWPSSPTSLNDVPGTDRPLYGQYQPNHSQIVAPGYHQYTNTYGAQSNMGTTHSTGHPVDPRTYGNPPAPAMQYNGYGSTQDPTQYVNVPSSYVNHARYNPGSYNQNHPYGGSNN